MNPFRPNPKSVLTGLLLFLVGSTTHAQSILFKGQKKAQKQLEAQFPGIKGVQASALQRTNGAATAKQSTSCQDTLDITFVVRDGANAPLQVISTGDTAGTNNAQFYGVGQYFGIPDTFSASQRPAQVSVSGAVVYLGQPTWARDTQTLNVLVYQADFNGLPVGNVLGSSTVTVPPNSSSFRYEATFRNAAQVRYPGFFIAVENPNPETVFMLAYPTSPQLDSVFLTRVRRESSNNYLPAQTGANQQGRVSLMRPVVSYDIEADYVILSDTSCLKGGDQLILSAAEGSSPVLTTAFFNRYAAFGVLDSSYEWPVNNQNALYANAITVNIPRAANGRVTLPDLRLRMGTWNRGLCTDRIQGKTVPVRTSPVFVNGPRQVLCQGDSTRSITIDSANANATYQLGNNPQQTSNTFEDVAPGNYNIIVRNGSGCVDTLLLKLRASTDETGLSVDQSKVDVNEAIQITPQENGASSCELDLGDGTVLSTCDATTHRYQTDGIYEITFSTTFPGGCSYVDSATVTVGDPSGLASTANLQPVQIWPQPASNHLYLNLPDLSPQSAWRVSLMDVRGGAVLRARDWVPGEEPMDMHVGHLSPGTYILRMEQGRQAPKHRKVVIQR